LIRSATQDDANALARLAGQLGYPVDAAELAWRLASILADREQAVLVADTPGAGVTGWIHICPAPRLIAPPFAEIGGLIVDERHRGQGAGRALLRAAEGWAQAQGYARLRIRSSTIRSDAHRFYERTGYERVKTQYIFDRTL
jgi:GNAT superfamily N-acetyltransferase